MQHDEPSARRQPPADLRAEIMEFGEECRWQGLLRLRRAEERRHQCCDGAFMGERRHCPVERRNDISRQQPQGDAERREQAERNPRANG